VAAAGLDHELVAAPTALGLVDADLTTHAHGDQDLQRLTGSKQQGTTGCLGLVVDELLPLAADRPLQVLDAAKGLLSERGEPRVLCHQPIVRGASDICCMMAA
jgi:hypothetical protein